MALFTDRQRRFWARLVLRLGPRKMRRNAAHLLGEIGNHDDLPRLLITARMDRDDMVRVHAIRASAKFGPLPDVRALLNEALGENNEYILAAAAELLGKVGGPESIRPLIALRGKFKPIRDFACQSALSLLSNKQIPPDISLLTELVTDEKEEFRAAAARGLGRVPNETTIELVRRLTNDASPSVQHMAATVLIDMELPLIMKLPPGNRFEFIEQRLSHPDASLRQAGLAHITADHPNVLQLLLHANNDSSVMVQNAAISAIIRVLNQGSVPVLKAVLEWFKSGRNYGLLGKAKYVLEHMRTATPEQIELLLAADQDLTHPCRANGAALNVLERLAVPKAIGLLLERLTARPREQTVIALRNAGWQPEDKTQRALEAVALGKWNEAIACGSAIIEPLIRVAPTFNTEQFKSFLGTLVETRTQEAREATFAIASRLDFFRHDQWRVLADAMVKIGGEQAVNVLIKALSNKKWAITSIAAESLSTLGWKPTTSQERALYAVATKKWYKAAKEGAVASEALKNAIDEVTFPVESAVKQLCQAECASVVGPLMKLWSQIPETQKSHVLSLFNVIAHGPKIRDVSSDDLQLLTGIPDTYSPRGHRTGGRSSYDLRVGDARLDPDTETVRHSLKGIRSKAKAELARRKVTGST